MITVKVVSSNRKRFFIRQGVCFFLLLLENCDIMIKNVPLLMENSQNAIEKEKNAILAKNEQLPWGVQIAGMIF